MSQIKLITRWVLSPYETLSHPAGYSTTQPIVAEYASKYLVPRILEDLSPCYCEMTQHQWQAARQDTRLIILDSVHSAAPIPAKAAEQFAPYGVKPTHTVHDLLLALHDYFGDATFIPEN